MYVHIRTHSMRDFSKEVTSWHTETNVTGPSWRYILEHFRWVWSGVPPPSDSSVLGLFLDRPALEISDGLLETNLCFFAAGTYIRTCVST